jgi:mercuric ion transport protein
MDIWVVRMGLISRCLDKIGALGVLMSALGCAACFPLLGSIGGLMGLGALASYEGLFINTLLPIFAGIAFVANGWHWMNHQHHLRGVLSLLGPLFILVTLYPLWKYGWSTNLFYTGIILMLSVSIADIVYPVKRQCEVREK